MSEGVLHRHRVALLSVPDAANTSQTGSAHLIRSLQHDEVDESRQGFKVLFQLTQAGGATSPTVDAALQTSDDGANWITVTSATQLTADGAVTEVKDISTVLLRYVRATTTLAGGTNPDHTASIVLVSNSGFESSVVS